MTIKGFRFGVGNKKDNMAFITTMGFDHIIYKIAPCLFVVFCY